MRIKFSSEDFDKCPDNGMCYFQKLKNKIDIIINYNKSFKYF